MIKYYLITLRHDKTEEEFNEFWKNNWKRDFGVKRPMIQQDGLYVARINSKPKIYNKHRQITMNVYDGNDECLVMGINDMYNWFKVVRYINYCKDIRGFMNIRKTYHENKYTNDGYNKMEMERYIKHIFLTPISKIHNLHKNENLISFIKVYCRINKINLGVDEIEPIAKELSQLIIEFVLNNDADPQSKICDDIKNILSSIEELGVCPVCGKNPRGGSYNGGIALKFKHFNSDFVTCTHCGTRYNYKYKQV